MVFLEGRREKKKKSCRLLTGSSVPVQPMTEYLRARRHSLTWCLKETAASRRRAMAWSCSWVDRGKCAGPYSSCAGSSSCMACSSLAGPLLLDLMTTSSAGVGVAIALGVGRGSMRAVGETTFGMKLDRFGSVGID